MRSAWAGVRQVGRGQRLEGHAERHAFGQPAADALAENQRNVAVGQLGSGRQLLRQSFRPGEDFRLRYHLTDSSPGQGILGREGPAGESKEAGTVQSEDLLPDDESPSPGAMPNAR
jgi:hypothetical protein